MPEQRMWFQHLFFHNEIWMWGFAVVLGLAAIPLLQKCRSLLALSLKRLAVGKRARLMNLAAEMVRHTHPFLIYILAWNIGLMPLFGLPEQWPHLSLVVLQVALLIQSAIWLSSLIDFYIDSVRIAKLESDPATVTTIAALSFLGKISCYILIFVLGWHFVFGQEPTALITGLGVGGIAIGLAAQHILGDLFASITIVLDRPFVIGDFIIVGEFMGTIEHVGLKSTRLRSLSGEQLVFSNQDLLSSRIRNYKRMFERRILFSVKVAYNTPLDKLKTIPAMIRGFIEAQPKTRFDRSHFSAFGDNALTIETVYYVLVPDYNYSMDLQQQINFSIIEHFANEGIPFFFTPPPPAPLPQPLPASQVADPQNIIAQAAGTQIAGTQAVGPAAPSSASPSAASSTVASPTPPEPGLGHA